MAAVVDYGDALDIETALQETAAQLKLAGSADTLDGRRAAALGEIARNQLSLTFEAPDGVGSVEERASRHRAPVKRPVTLYVHLAEDALTGAGGMGRCENARTPITADTIRFLVRQPQHHVDGEAGHRPGRPHPGRCLRGPEQAQGTCCSAGLGLCVSVVHPPRPGLRPRPRHPPRRRWVDVFVQCRAVVSTSPPLEDPYAVAVQAPRTRRLSMDQPAWLRVPPRPLRHHRRHPGRVDPHPRLPRHAADADPPPE